MQGRAEADIGHPDPVRARLVGKPVHGQRHVATDRTGRIAIGPLDAPDVPRHAVAERAEQSREGAVQVVAVAPAPPPHDPLGGFQRVDRRVPAKLYLEVLVGNALDVRPVQEAKRLDAGLARVGEAEPVEVTRHIEPARRGHRRILIRQGCAEPLRQG